MRVRYLALCLFVGLGCRGLSGSRSFPEPPTVSSREKSLIIAANFEEKQTGPTRTEDDGLTRAANCIEKGDQAGAIVHLEQHLRAHPEQIMIRSYLAELLLKMGRLPEARDSFERFIAEAQEATGAAQNHILHCHTRLKEIALDRDDAYSEHLHRGIGLILLARRVDAGATNEEVEPGFRERLLCKAADALTIARKIRPDEPRPCWYLFEVWTKLDQPRSAERALERTKCLAARMPLPPMEQKLMYAAR